MNDKSRIISVLLASFFMATNTFAQLTVGTEIRPRAEVRAGYKDLYSKGQSANEIATQRTRLNAGFKTENVKTYISLQNVSIWGEQAKTSSIARTATSSDTSSLTSIFEAWGELNLCKNNGLRLGRQSLAIEDERLLTAGGWSQAAQSLDGVLYHFDNDSIAKIRVFGSYNNDKDGRLASTMAKTKMKTFNFIDIKKEFNKNINATLVEILSGTLKPGAVYNTYYKNTMGGYITIKNEELAFSGSGFYQTGKSASGLKASAYLVNAQIKFTKKPYEVSAGFDILSGNDMKNTDAKYLETDHSFDVLLGTTRPFQGTMELVNTRNSTQLVAGLFNPFLKTKYQITDAWSVGINYFMLNAQNNITYTDASHTVVDLNKYLGQEVDGLISYKVNADVSFDFGYCYLRASESLRKLKAPHAFENQNWAWVQLTFKPKLFEGAYKN